MSIRNALIASATRLVLQIQLDGREEFLLACFLGDIELGDGALREPHIRDDRAVRVVVEVKERDGPVLERAGSPFTQLA